MSSGGKKTIKINQDFFSLGGKSRKKKGKSLSRKKRSKPTNTSRTSKKMRKEFFSKIRALQEKKRKENTSVTTKTDIALNKNANGFNDSFNKSLAFLSTYVQDKKRKNNKKRKTIRKREKEQLQISLDMPSELTKSIDSVNSLIQTVPGVISQPVQVITDTKELKVSVRPRPPYSNLKGSTLPTFRQWKRLQTMKKNKETGNTRITIIDKPETIGEERSAKLKEIKDKMKSDKKIKKKRMMKIKKSTKTIKRKLGKVDGTRKVSVLIKSRESRKNVQTEKVKLGQVSVIDIKKYLKDKSLIRSGSKAPNDVLRKMYEQSILAGDISNKSGSVLLHNYVSSE